MATKKRFPAGVPGSQPPFVKMMKLILDDDKSKSKQMVN